jgi:NTP pyrophosphatase (non-canonical NTP hydrolase)
VKFEALGSLRDFQTFIGGVYALPDDRLYSIWDLLTQQQRFTMRALKGIRKGNQEKIKLNLLIAFSWLMAIANRLHLDLDAETWQRFPALCSYCGHSPCVCKSIKPAERLKVLIDESKRPKAISDMQKMFASIYPASSRTIADAGVHLAEEMGEVSEAIHNFLGEHKADQFSEVALELADFVSCAMGLANSADIDMAKDLSEMYKEGCHVCHKAPCQCTFSSVATLKS